MRRLTKDGVEIHVIRPTPIHRKFRWGAKYADQDVRGKTTTEHEAWVKAEEAASSIIYGLADRQRYADEEGYDD